MSEEDVVGKVGDLMRTLDDVKRYRELAYAMVDFAAIIVISVIVVIALTTVQFLADVIFGSPNSVNGQALLLFGPAFPASLWLLVGEIIVLASGLLFGVYWVDRRVSHTQVGEWKGALDEGAPGAIKILSGIDWDSLLGTVSLARVSYLFYALIKVVGYFVLTTILLSLALLYSGLFTSIAMTAYIPFIALFVVLLLTRKSIAEGFSKLRKLDSLFWDLRWFASEFKRAEFNQA